MVAIHERALHEKLDRMINANMTAEIDRWGTELRAGHKRFFQRKVATLGVLCRSELKGTNVTSGPADWLRRAGVPETLDGTSLRRNIGEHCDAIRRAQSLVMQAHGDPTKLNARSDVHIPIKGVAVASCETLVRGEHPPQPHDLEYFHRT